MSEARPERIWLQTLTGGDVTWCDEDVTDDGTEYVRADVARAAAEAMRERCAAYVEQSELQVGFLCYGLQKFAAAIRALPATGVGE